MIAPKRIVPYVVIAVLSVAVALFFALFYSYHLFHREQYSLFMMNSEYVREIIERGSFSPDAWLSVLIGDFLTQFYFYLYAGPAIVGIVVMLIGLLCYRLLSRIGLDWKMALVVAVAFMVWEAMRECVNEYPMASSISLLLGFCMANLVPLRGARWVKVVVVVVLSVFGAWAVGYGSVIVIAIAIAGLMREEIVAVVMCVLTLMASAGWEFEMAEWYGYPNMFVERLFEVDTEYNRGKDISQIVASDDLSFSLVGNYYKMMSLVRTKKQDALSKLDMQLMTPFLAVDPSANYFTITMAGNVWFELGDMTMAEHAAMLGMIFSPYHHGTRHLRRLAEINIINGDDVAAQKYLHMLSQTIPHKKWAEARKKENRTDSYKAWLDMKRSYIPKQDTLRSSADYRKSLCNLLDANMQNDMARTYLFALELKNKAILDFADDYLKYGNGVMCRDYAEALLISMVASSPDMREKIMKAPIPYTVVSEFAEFNDYIEAQDMTSLKLKYKDTYWFYFQFIK